MRTRTDRVAGTTRWGLPMWRAAIGILFAAVLSNSPSFADDAPKRVLLLISYNLAYTGQRTIAQGAMDRLLDRSPATIELLTEFLDVGRFPGAEHAARTAGYLADKYRDRRPDIVLTIGGEASQFILKNRDAIAPNVPIVACWLPPQGFSAQRAVNLTGIVNKRDISPTLELAERLQPEARELVVIGGATDFGREKTSLSTNTFAESQPRCAQLFEISWLRLR
jgi:hypothetical protein